MECESRSEKLQQENDTLNRRVLLLQEEATDMNKLPEGKPGISERGKISSNTEEIKNANRRVINYLYSFKLVICEFTQNKSHL